MDNFESLLNAAISQKITEAEQFFDAVENEEDMPDEFHDAAESREQMPLEREYDQQFDKLVAAIEQGNTPADVTAEINKLDQLITKMDQEDKESIAGKQLISDTGEIKAFWSEHSTEYQELYEELNNQ